jgi:hypothetical protein
MYNVKQEHYILTAWVWEKTWVEQFTDLALYKLVLTSVFTS